MSILCKPTEHLRLRRPNWRDGTICLLDNIGKGEES